MQLNELLFSFIRTSIPFQKIRKQYLSFLCKKKKWNKISKYYLSNKVYLFYANEKIKRKYCINHHVFFENLLSGAQIIANQIINPVT